ncbi:thioesterase family protein [Nocardioides sp.]|uniref:thioesterase family protein n=1 Tax=Nocardioides sp. TaxID=35761 RepID=UPI003D0F403D
MDFEFDRTTSVTSIDGGFELDLDPGWVVGGGVNGGYLLAVLGRAVRRTLPGKPDPFSVSAHYLSASVPGPARVQTHVVRDGGRTGTARAELSQAGEARITALATFGDLAALPDEVRTTALPPDLPPLEDCVQTAMAPAETRRTAPVLDRFDLRLDPSSIGWALGAPSGRGVIQGWTRLADGREPDPLALLMFCDSLPPVTYDLGLMGWAPTIELTCHVRAVPAPGWLRIRHATTNLAGGMFEEDCDLWDSRGRLVAQSRQLAFAPRG